MSKAAVSQQEANGSSRSSASGFGMQCDALQPGRRKWGIFASLGGCTWVLTAYCLKLQRVLSICWDVNTLNKSSLRTVLTGNDAAATRLFSRWSGTRIAVLLSDWISSAATTPQLSLMKILERRHASTLLLAHHFFSDRHSEDGITNLDRSQTPF